MTTAVVECADGADKGAAAGGQLAAVAADDEAPDQLTELVRRARLRQPSSLELFAGAWQQFAAEAGRTVGLRPGSMPPPLWGLCAPPPQPSEGDGDGEPVRAITDGSQGSPVVVRWVRVEDAAASQAEARDQLDSKTRQVEARPCRPTRNAPPVRG